MTPVMPPIVNIDKKPMVHKIGVSRLLYDETMVESQLKILIPVGTAITIVAAVK